MIDRRQIRRTHGRSARGGILVGLTVVAAVLAACGSSGAASSAPPASSPPAASAVPVTPVVPTGGTAQTTATPIPQASTQPSPAATPNAAYEAIAGDANTRAAATALQHRLVAGFVIEVDGTGGTTIYEVERTYTTKSGAATEVTKLHAAGFTHARAETDK
jgi:hypothetical protein